MPPTPPGSAPGARPSGGQLAFVERSSPSSASSGPAVPSSFVPLAPVAVAPYLEAFGFAAADSETWRGGSREAAGSGSPVLELKVAGHSELDGRTHYSLACSLVDGPATTSWVAPRRLQQLREDLHDNIKANLGEAYAQHFATAPFAHKGGLPGTTARLNAWFAALSACVNSGQARPSLVALVLQFLEAPERELDAGTALESKLESRAPPSSPSSLAPRSVGRGEDPGGNCVLDDIQLSLEWEPDELPVSSAAGGSSASAPASTSQKFEARIVKGSLDEKLGVDTVARKFGDGHQLRIQSVKVGGLADLWNQANPDLKLEPGCIITSVNGERSHSEAMYTVIARESVLELQVLRPAPRPRVLA